MYSDEVIFVIREDKYLSVFYSDGKHIVRKDDISKYKLKVKNRYKNPIEINRCYLYPAKTINNKNCIYVNVNKFIENEEYYNYLLKYFDLYYIVKKMYIKQMIDE